MKAIILAGGKGENLRPITHELPKCLLPIKGSTLLDHNIDLYFKHQTFEIWLSLAYKQRMILDKYPTMPYLREIENTPLGTGGWLAYINNKHFNEDFYVNNAENLSNMELDLMLEQHKKQGNLVTMGCVQVKDVTKYGSVHIKDNLVQSFEEKAKSRIKKSGWVNSGYYIFSPKIFSWLNKNLPHKKGENISLEHDVFPLLAKQLSLGAYQSSQPWFDTNSFESYEKLLREWNGNY